MVHLLRYSSSSSSSSRKEHVVAVCVRALEGLYQSSCLRVCSLPYFLPLGLFSLSRSILHFSLIFSACRSRGGYSPAKMQHLCIARMTFRPTFLQNESIERPLYDERRNFPVGTDDIFRENIGNFIPTSKINSSPLFRKKKRISFLFNKGELISNLF